MCINAANVLPVDLDSGNVAIMRWFRNIEVQFEKYVVNPAMNLKVIFHIERYYIMLPLLLRKLTFEMTAVKKVLVLFFSIVNPGVDPERLFSLENLGVLSINPGNPEYLI
ncbi:hypothetical protein NQ317_004903 [Molorchus minor]|uniref:Uncharacterized protein n=1 Tax=Molorchus minor TaxID=1323400 RepID=A0ABQ9JNR3_9CUCU|nr:hypothetical protein NQ317_004903 [Molorchus minor]